MSLHGQTVSSGQRLFYTRYITVILALHTLIGITLFYDWREYWGLHEIAIGGKS